MIYKISKLEGTLLDLAVDKARSKGPTGEDDFLLETTLDWSPSTNWQQAGAIIEREWIAIYPPEEDEYPPDWTAAMVGRGSGESWADPIKPGNGSGTGRGSTPLIAAMRAYVASKFGEEVELP